MISIKASNTVKLRIAVQIIFLLVFLILFFKSTVLAEYFFWLDPLPLITNLISSGEVISLFLISLIPLALTLFLGRFFCGWVCPFGTINQFFSWLFKKSNKRKEGADKKLLSIKYILLFLLIAASLLELQIWGWIDPFSLLTRGIASLLPAVDFLFQKTTLIGEGESLFRKSTLSTSLPYITGGFFLFLLGMNYFQRRFFCNVLCPVGAIYGLIARIGLLKFKTTEDCNQCKVCAKNCTFNGNPDDQFMKSECLVCFNCLKDCPSASVDFGYKISDAKPAREIDLSRRKLIGSVVTGFALASVLKSSVEAKNKRRHPYMRPPGSIKEESFIDKCARCGQCVKSCPTGFIQPAFLQGGIEGLWTPVLDAQIGYCIYECKRCTEVCPTKAIEKLTFDEKKVFKMGRALVNKNKCYTYADGFNCTVCADKCPAEYKAIKFREVETVNYSGQQVVVKQIYVNPDNCTGCGICVNACPRTDAPGIIITAEDEQREKVTGII